MEEENNKHMSKFKIVERIAVWAMLIFMVGGVVLASLGALVQNGII